MYRFALLVIIALQSFGLMGQEYFQQEVNTRIEVQLNDQDHLLKGQIAMEYINHSPDVLNKIYMHHWPNAYSSPESPMAQQLIKNGRFHFQFSGTENMGHITGLDYRINGVRVSFNYDNTPVDYCQLDLPAPLLPGDTITIETPFEVAFPGAEVSRLGHDDQAYYATQWYPKPAVYDRDGWHPMSYLSQGEFYSEFGTFDVQITVPSNYVVMATGTLQNQEERAWLKSLDEYTRSKSSFSDDMTHPPSSNETKTLRYLQKNIHDFAWFADKRYNVLYDQVSLPHSGDTVEIWSAFTNNEPELWKRSTEYLSDAVHYYSLWVGDYPYRTVCAVDGTISEGAGMEYPTITLIGESGRPIDLETVIMHEVGHNWFYGALGSNEREHPWLDEGLNSAIEQRYLATKYPNLNLLGSATSNRLLKLARADELLQKDQYHIGYLLNARRHLDQPIALPSTEYTPYNYGAMVYGKSALVINYLRAYIGNDAFDQMMQAYYSEYRFKHPSPEDFLRHVRIALKNRDYWMHQLIHTTHKTDFKAAGLKKRDNNYSLNIKSVGKVNGPVSYALVDAADSVLLREWIAPFGNDTVVTLPGNDFHRVVLDDERNTLDINRKNNKIRKSGLFRKMEPIRFQWLAGLEEPDRTTLYFSPLLGYNTTDQAMAGLLLHNQNIFQKRMEFRLAPMWGFGSERFNWMGALRYNFRFQQSRWIENLWVEANSTSFSTGGIPNRDDFTQIQLAANLDFKRQPLNRNLSHHLYYSWTAVRETSPGFDETINVNDNYYGQIVYSARNSLRIRPYDLNVGFDLHEHFDRMWVELNTKFVFNANKRAAKARLFFGSFAYNNTNNARYNFRMDGINGPQDFRYEHIFAGRYDNSGILSQQFVSGHGNFKVPTANGQSSEWIGALNLKLEAPFKIPLGIYADVGISAFSGPGSEGLLYNAGLYAWLVPDAVEVYFPLIFSEAIEREIEANGLKYVELIRFMVNFNEINPLNLMRNIAR